MKFAEDTKLGGIRYTEEDQDMIQEEWGDLEE